MINIPEYLKYLHQQEEKKSKNLLKREGRICYDIEDLFFRPVFNKSETIIRLAKELKTCKTKNSFTRKYKSIYSKLQETLGCDFSFKLTVKDSTSTCNYNKKTIFINRRSYNRAFENDNINYCQRLLYTTIH